MWGARGSVLQHGHPALFLTQANAASEGMPRTRSGRGLLDPHFLIGLMQGTDVGIEAPGRGSGCVAKGGGSLQKDSQISGLSN